MILNSRSNLFNFKFPKSFVPEEVADKYRDYLNRMPGNVITEPIDFVNYAIQGVSMPGISFDPSEQAPNDGTITYKRGLIPVQNMIDRQFTVTMQLLDGFINYWIMTDALLYHYNKDNKKPFIDDVKLQILDGEGIHMMSVVFEKPIMNSISELELNMASNIAEFSTFDITFYYNKFNMINELD
tara:strand:+ start:2269 stop:2820 length:552 start_codon:yes stop_codon:yes gene_type:complete